MGANLGLTTKRKSRTVKSTSGRVRRGPKPASTSESRKVSSGQRATRTAIAASLPGPRNCLRLSSNSRQFSDLTRPEQEAPDNCFEGLVKPKRTDYHDDRGSVRQASPIGHPPKDPSNPIREGEICFRRQRRNAPSNKTISEDDLEGCAQMPVDFSQRQPGSGIRFGRSYIHAIEDRVLAHLAHQAAPE